MALADLGDWLDDFTGKKFVWYVKRLSANDTLANNTHQAGPYIPKKFLFDIIPNLKQTDIKNPRVQFTLYVDSHIDVREVTAIWYNNKYYGGTRDEARITNFGGRQSALLDPESTGALTVFVFVMGENDQDEIAVRECHVWVCNDEIEESLIEERIGLIEPGQAKIFSLSNQNYFGAQLFPPKKNPSCFLQLNDIPVHWLTHFPTGHEIIKKTLLLCPDNGQSVDKRLINRRKCEYDLFLSLEEAVELPRIQKGFTSIDSFVERAQTILQRRKARSGRSLELHVREIFLEENLIEGVNFSYQSETEKKQRPDFIFPSKNDYQNPHFPQKKLHMLAVKTTCKDRWRQILREADRIPKKHLLTLQEGVSENQFQEMIEAGVQLVVPQSLIKMYPSTVQPHLKNFESFIGDIRLISP